MSWKKSWSGWGVLGIIFIGMYILNYWMPLHRDDYEYSLIWNTTVRIASMSDVVHSLYIHYFTHGGRMVSFFALDSFLLWGKEYFNVANSLVYVIVLLLMVWHSLGRITSHLSPYRVGLAGTLAWLCYPHYGEVAVWACGATVYLWSAMWILLFLLPYHMQWRSTVARYNTIGMSMGMFFLGIIAGWGIENTSLTMLLLAIVGTWKRRQIGAAPLWQYTGIIGAFMGFMMLVLAPGNVVRSEQQYGNVLRRIGNQFAGNGEMLLYILPAIFIAMIVYVILMRAGDNTVDTLDGENRKKNSWKFWIVGCIALLLGISYMTSNFIGLSLGYGIIHYVIAPFHAVTPKLTEHIMNVTTRVEEYGLYLLLLFILYKYASHQLGVSGVHANKKENSIYKQLARLSREYKPVAFALCCYGLALFNNLVMLGAPTFPARATFGSVLFIVVGTLALGNIPSVQDRVKPLQKRLTIVVLLVIIPFYVGTVYVSQQLFHLDGQRVAIIQGHENSNELVYLDPNPVEQRLVRHIFYVDFDNGVTRAGITRYYKIKDIEVNK